LLGSVLTFVDSSNGKSLTNEHKSCSKGVHKSHEEVIKACIDPKAPKDDEDDGGWVPNLNDHVRAIPGEERSGRGIHFAGNFSLDDGSLHGNLEDDIQSCADTHLI